MTDTSATAPPASAPSQNGSGNAMAPPPLHIPTNNNPIPTAITSPMGENSGIMSPTSPGGFRRAAPEPNKRALYVGGLDQRVTEDVLRQIFETTGHVQNVKIIPDKNVIYTISSSVMVCANCLTYRPRASTTVSSSTMTLVRRSVPCRP